MRHHCFAEKLLNIHEDVHQKYWILIAFMPIYDSDKSERLSQGYECNSGRAMRLHHDGWILDCGCTILSDSTQLESQKIGQSRWSSAGRLLPFKFQTFREALLGPVG